MVVDFKVLREIAAQNFRDLGGHPTRDRRHVRKKTIYRSSHLAEVPHEHPVRSVPLKTLVTLQSRIEVRHLGRPHDHVLRGVRWEHIPMGDIWFKDAAFNPLIEPGKEHLNMLNSCLPDWQRFFKLLAESDVYPLLFHCSAGRDRTGLGAALLLELLGVERKRIVGDFLESNHTFPGSPLSERQLEPIFELIDRAGGVNAFMRNVIGLTDSELETIRRDLLD